MCEGLTGLPEGLSELTALKTLDLTWCEGLRELPEGLSALTALQTLDLFGCSGVTALPEGLSALTELQTLNLEGFGRGACAKRPHLLYTLQCRQHWCL